MGDVSSIEEIHNSKICKKLANYMQS